MLVLEQGPLVGAGAVVKSPEGCGNWEFETGVQCLGGGSKLGRFVGRLRLAFLPGRGVTYESCRGGSCRLSLCSWLGIGVFGHSNSADVSHWTLEFS